jgi:hypothetical protein
MSERLVLSTLIGARPAGVPFEALHRLGSPSLRPAMARLGDAVERAHETLARAPAAEAGLAHLLASCEEWLRGDATARPQLGAKRWRAHAWLAPCDEALRAVEAALAALDADVASEQRRVNAALREEAARWLPDFLVIESVSMLDQLAVLAHGSDRLDKSDRKHDRALAMYLQRVCAKNDSISRFGPFVWGRLVPGAGLHVRAKTLIASRTVQIERWIVKGLLARINAETDVRLDLCPRLQPHGRFEGSTFVRLDDDREIELAAPLGELARRCTGHVPAHAIGDAAALDDLVARGVIRWELEPMGIDAAPLASLAAEIATWRDTPARARWAGHVAALDELAQRFGAEPSAHGRRELLVQVEARLGAIGMGGRDDERTLYAAKNPINENCLQATELALGADTAQAVLDDARPWLELFADAVGFVAKRAFDALAPVARGAPRRGGVLAYSTLIRAARAQGIEIENDRWHTKIGSAGFGEIKRELAARLSARPDAPEWTLTAGDCEFLRGRYRSPSRELAYPSLDLQPLTGSADDAAHGRMQWLLAELHFAPVLLQHGSYWSCPDKPALHASMARIIGGPVCVRDAYGEPPVHICGESITSVPGATYAGSGRPKPGWRAVRPADAHVVIDDEREDIRLRGPAGEDLGSIVRTLRLLAGLHPFFPFERAPHAPRLRIGDVVVQRQTWHVDGATLGTRRPNGVSARFIAAIERERAARGIPRWVFVRPAPEQLQGAAWFARDKDNKPLYIDLESAVFLDILERRFRKYGTLVLTEMLPTPEQTIWRTDEGAFTFELRTNVEPAP